MSQSATERVSIGKVANHGRLLAEIFKTEKTQLGRFLDITSEILQAMAGLAEEIEGIFPAGLQATKDTMPHEMRHIILLYHQVSYRKLQSFDSTDHRDI